MFLHYVARVNTNSEKFLLEILGLNSTKQNGAGMAPFCRICTSKDFLNVIGNY